MSKKRARDISGCRECPLWKSGCLGMEFEETGLSFAVVRDPPCFSWEGEEWISDRMVIANDIYDNGD